MNGFVELGEAMAVCGSESKAAIGQAVAPENGSRKTPRVARVTQFAGVMR